MKVVRGPLIGQQPACRDVRLATLPVGINGRALNRPKRVVLVSQSSSNGSGRSSNGAKPTATPVLDQPAAVSSAATPAAGGSAHTTPPATPSRITLAAAAGAVNDVKHANGTAPANGAAVNGAVLNGTAAGNSAGLASHQLGADVHGSMDPCDAGQSLTCSVTKLTELEAAEKLEASKEDQIVDKLAAAAATAAVNDADKRGDADRIKGSPYLAAGGRWSSLKGASVWRRNFQIYSFAIKFGLRYWRISKEKTYKKLPGGMSLENVSARKTEVARWLRDELIKLGPTFIKIGQQFSTRVDVLSAEFIRELEQLQDNVPAFDAETVAETIERNFGKPANQIFKEFNFTPIAAASLGQVHLAKLNGQRVVVKVQRPGLKDLFDIDLKNVRVLAVWLQKLDPKSDGAARDWVAIYDECSRILYEEIDYRQEATYAKEFAANFADTDWVKVPEIYSEYSNREVLVMEYCPGVKINQGDKLDEMGLDRDRLARLSVESYLQQLLRHGLFHADPHPGNVAVDAVGGGRLIYYDFGMMGRIVPGVRLGLLDLFYGVYKKDSDKCLDALVKMGVLVDGGDRTAIKRTAEFFLKSFQDRLEQQRLEKLANPSGQDEFKPQRDKDESKAKRKEILATIGEDLLIAAADQPFRFPATFTFVVRSFTVLDGIGKSLSPRFDISEISAPYARELLLEGRPYLTKFKDDFSRRWFRQEKAVKGLFTGPIKIDEMAAFLERIESGNFKPRVRALETERALQRVQAWQTVMGAMVAASMFVNVGTVLSVSALPVMSTFSFVCAGALAVFTLLNVMKVRKLEKKEKQLLGQA